MGASEYETWWQFYQIDPWGTQRDNFHAAHIAAAVVNSRAARPRGAKTVPLSVFMYDAKQGRQPASLARSMAFFRAVAKRKGAA